ncbi:hypothetical protein TNCV_3278061 [Trichonephila clavipes]|nr:hypothetical protein TNCV_3278061 [Trichonephila clavipes]
MHTAQECNDFCEKLEELIFYSCNNKESVLGLEELRLVNNVSWLCIKIAKKANVLLATEHQKVLMAIAANQSPSPASTPSKSSSDIEVSNDFSTPVKCKRTYKSPNKGTAKKSQPSEEVIALSNSYTLRLPL